MPCIEAQFPLPKEFLDEDPPEIVRRVWNHIIDGQDQGPSEMYRKSVLAAINAIIINRLEEIMGRVPSDDERMLRGVTLIDPTRGGAAIWKWRMGEGQPDEPLCEFVPAGFDLQGRWQGAEISELRSEEVGS